MERDCSLDSIDVHIPKLDVAGSIPVSRSFVSMSYGFPAIFSVLLNGLQRAAA